MDRREMGTCAAGGVFYVLSCSGLCSFRNGLGEEGHELSDRGTLEKTECREILS